MRKITLSILILVSTLCTSQIPVITPEENPIEFVRLRKDAAICFEKQTKKCELIIYSSNAFESKTANIYLGKTLDEIVTSLKNLSDVMKHEDTHFTIDQYHFYVKDAQTIAILPEGKLEYSAGNYNITNEIFQVVYQYLIVKKGLSPGDDCSIRVYSVFSSSAYFWVSLPTYGVKNFLMSLDLNVSADFHDIIRDDGDKRNLRISEIELLKKYITTGKVQMNNEADFFYKVASSITDNEPTFF